MTLVMRLILVVVLCSHVVFLTQSGAKAGSCERSHCSATGRTHRADPLTPHSWDPTGRTPTPALASHPLHAPPAPRCQRPPPPAQRSQTSLAQPHDPTHRAMDTRHTTNRGEGQQRPSMSPTVPFPAGASWPCLLRSRPRCPPPATQAARERRRDRPRTQRRWTWMDGWMHSHAMNREWVANQTIERSRRPGGRDALLRAASVDLQAASWRHRVATAGCSIECAMCAMYEFDSTDRFLIPQCDSASRSPLRSRQLRSLCDARLPRSASLVASPLVS